MFENRKGKADRRGKRYTEMTIDALIIKNDRAVSRPCPCIAEVKILLIKGEVANVFHIEESALESKCRNEVVSLARHVAMYLLRQETDLTLEEVGALLGSRTPASVSHGYLRIAESLCDNTILKRKVTGIQRGLH